MIYTPQQVRDYRDFWTDYTATVLPSLCDLEHSGCFGMRYVQAPKTPDQSLAALAYQKYTLQLQVGAFITGISHKTSVGFVWKVTDTNLDHVWNDTPLPEGPILDPRPGQPWMPAAPYPVTGQGIFLVEFWNPTNATLNGVELTFRIAERLDLPPGPM